MEHTVEQPGLQYVITYSLKAGINKFAAQAKASAHKDMKQLHDRSSYWPVHKCSLNKSERQRAIQSLLFLTEKRDKTIKSQHCANRSTECTYMECDEIKSPTMSTQGTLLTAVIKAQEGQDIATYNILNAFVQTHVEEKDKDGN